MSTLEDLQRFLYGEGEDQLDLMLNALSLGVAAGAFMNEVYRLRCGKASLDDAEVQGKMAGQLNQTLVMLCQTANALGIDLTKTSTLWLENQNGH